MKTKTAYTLIVISSLFLANVGSASERHEADKAIETNLRATLDQRHVHVHVHEGIVTLEGHVRTETDRQSIESLVRSTPGVAAVKDKLNVALPSPGDVVAAPTYRTTIPVYVTPPPAQVITPAPVVTLPAPVVIPEYPKLKVQAYTGEDQAMAERIARQLAIDGVPTEGIGQVVITVHLGVVSLKGDVESHEDHDALIAAVQHAGGMKAIYDQLQIS
jgi:osmotically-inducible protein OsmY